MKYFINKTLNFSHIEEVNIELNSTTSDIINVIKDNQKIFTCRKIHTLSFLLKRYLYMIVPTLFLSIMYLYLYPLPFLFYTLFAIFLMLLSIRLCFVKAIGKYIMVLWILHLFSNFWVLISDISILGLDYSNKLYYIQGLFLGMMLVNLWIYVFIFLLQYKEIYNIVEKNEDNEYTKSGWFIWCGCKLCDKTFSPFNMKCKHK